MKQSLKVLLLEDSRFDAELLRENRAFGEIEDVGHGE